MLEPVLKEMLRNPYFDLKPPRTAGREEFGREYAARVSWPLAGRVSKKAEDAMATATALTAESIAGASSDLYWPAMKGAPIDYIVSGGGARNRTLMKMLAAAGAAWVHAYDERTIRHAGGSERSGGVCAACVGDMESAARERAKRDGSETVCDSGTDHVCVGCSGWARGSVDWLSFGVRVR